MVDMILTARTCINGSEQPAGALVSVDLQAAARLMETACARLVDASDLVAVLRNSSRGRATGNHPGHGAFVTRNR